MPPRAPAAPPVFADEVPGRRVALSYLLLVVLPLLGVLWVEVAGGGHAVPAPQAPGATPAGAAAAFALPLFLLQIFVILAVARALGWVMRRLGQPQVVGEMVAGLLLGPSLLGLLAPHLSALLFPAGSVRFLNAVSQLGVVLFMFVMGLEIDLRELAGRSRQTVVTSHAGIAVPLLTGTLTAVLLYPAYAGPQTRFAVFALFLGCAMSITAFPVLARILEERRLAGTPFGVMAMECAALADISAWVILALVLGLSREGTAGMARALAHALGGLLLYLLVMLGAVRPLVLRLWRRLERRDAAGPLRLRDPQLTAVVLLVLASALATELLHVHALFGAFMAGVIMPQEPRVRAAIEGPFRQLLAVLLLPLFFAYAGLGADLGVFTHLGDWLICAAVIVVAVASKFGGSLLAARAMGASWRDAGSLGALMNARGLVELILLTVGLQLGIVTRPLFSAMVVMAVVTTAMTSPLLDLLMGRAKGATVRGGV